MTAPAPVDAWDVTGGIRVTNAANMVAEQGQLQGPGGLAVPVPQGGTPEGERGRRRREADPIL